MKELSKAQREVLETFAADRQESVDELEASLVALPETFASIAAAWDVIVDAVAGFAAWLEESGIEACKCHAECLAYKGECPCCIEED